MCWFSYQRSRACEDHSNKTACKPPSTCTAVTTSPLATTQWSRLLLLAVYGLQRCITLPCIVNGDDSAFFVFCPQWPWPLTLTFELWWDFCTVHPLPSFIILCLIVWKLSCRQTNKRQKNRRHWKHPPHFATLCRWVINIVRSIVFVGKSQIVSDIAIFVLKRDVKLQLTN